MRQWSWDDRVRQPRFSKATRLAGFCASQCVKEQTYSKPPGNYLYCFTFMHGGAAKPALWAYAWRFTVQEAKQPLLKPALCRSLAGAGEWSSQHTAYPGISFSPSEITGGKVLFGCFRKEPLQITLGISECGRMCLLRCAEERANSFVTVS